MQRRTKWTAGVVAGVVLAGSLGVQSMTAGAAFAADSSTVAPGPAAAVGAASQMSSSSFAGDWRFDPSRSDAPGGGRSSRGPRGAAGGVPGFSGGMAGMGSGEGAFGGEGRRSRGAGFGSGRRGGGNGGASGAGGPGGGMGGGFRMPERMHVEQSDSLLSLADSTGRVIERITLVAMPPDTAAANRGIFSYPGAWNARHELEVAHTTWRGTKVQDTYAIEDGGRTLVVTTHVAGDDRMPARTFKRVYSRVEG